MKLGFGSYRVAAGVFSQEQALRYALDNGVRVIDTSTNYSGGLSEQLIGKVVSHYDRDSFEVISKFGYIQGQLLIDTKAEKDVKDLVEYSDNCYHSIDSDFMSSQLTLSLQRLNLDYIDTYLLHNPEYFLMAAINDEKDKENYQNILMERIHKVFVALEKEVEQGRIKSYGISSNSFSLSKDALHFLPYATLVDSAQKAALEAGHVKHHFTTIELPINLVEKEGLVCAKWAKEQGLRVVVNRPLNAFDNNLFFRLASYDRPYDYEALLNETLHFLESQKLTAIATMISELDGIVHRFGWVGEYEDFLMREIMPNLRIQFEAIMESDRDQIAMSLEKFFESYAELVAHESGKLTVSSLKALKINVSEPIQEDALKFLLYNKDIDIVLLGMRKVKYVQDALTIEESL